MEPVRLDASLQPVFDELKAAVEEGEDEVARAILRRLRSRITEPVSARLAEGYAQILRGRAIRDAVQGEVLVEQVEGGFAVSLVLQQAIVEELRLLPGHVRVECSTRSIDAAGRQSTQVDNRVVERDLDWLLGESVSVTVPLGVDSPRIGEGFFAVRCKWRVTLGAGSAELGGELYPIMGLEVSDGVAVRLSKELSTEPVPPEELLRYALGEEVWAAALLERAVRISPERYAEALDLLGAREAELSPSRFEDLLPSLAWLTGSSVMSASGEEWRGWLKGRMLEQDRAEGLDLPDASISGGSGG